MADSIKVLGQASPAATTLTDLYTVPVEAQSTISSITVCNTDSSPVTIRVSVAVANAADSTKQYIYYDYVIGAKDTLLVVIGMTLNEKDKVRVYSSAANVAFNIFGVETSRE
jgi:hypothetical protein